MQEEYAEIQNIARAKVKQSSQGVESQQIIVGGHSDSVMAEVEQATTAGENVPEGADGGMEVDEISTAGVLTKDGPEWGQLARVTSQRRREA